MVCERIGGPWAPDKWARRAGTALTCGCASPERRSEGPRHLAVPRGAGVEAVGPGQAGQVALPGQIDRDGVLAPDHPGDGGVELGHRPAYLAGGGTSGSRQRTSVSAAPGRHAR